MTLKHTETQFLAAVVRDCMSDVPLIARVNQAPSVDRLHRLGVDFALSVDNVASELLAARLLGEEYVEVEPELRVVRLATAGLEGQHPWKVQLRERFGCQAVAVERSGEVLVNLTPEFRLEGRDSIFLCGSSQSIDAFLAVYPQAPAIPAAESDERATAPEYTETGTG